MPMFGELFVMIPGVHLMPMLFVDSWALLLQVYILARCYQEEVIGKLHIIISYSLVIRHIHLYLTGSLRIRALNNEVRLTASVLYYDWNTVAHACAAAKRTSVKREANQRLL